MTTVGGTGHQALPARALDPIRRELAALLPAGAYEAGYTCLAAGADQLFARELLRSGARLRVVVPSRDYATSFSDADLAAYRELLEQAESVIHCDFEVASEEAYWQAGRLVVESTDRLVAVWDGRASRGLGGTADVVRFAEGLGRPVDVVWPPGIERP